MAEYTPPPYTPAGQVDAAFDLTKGYADDAKDALTDFTDALNEVVYSPPVISATWQTMAAPTVADASAAPTLTTPTMGTFTEPLALTEVIPDVEMDAFTDTPPTTDFGVAPTVSYGATPTIPTVASIPVPDAPVVDMPSAPALLSLSPVTFAGLDMHESWLTKLEDIPELVIAQPTTFSHAVGPTYASALLDAVKNRLTSRLSGGSGLAPAVEQAIWDRARDRETKTALANEAEVYRTASALGNLLPAGALAAQLREAQQTYFTKLSDLSRDIAVKQADLEQANLKDAITAGIQLESSLVDYAVKLEQITFEVSKAYADNAIQVYNAGVEHYKALLSGYQTYAQAYQTIIQAEMAKVEVYKGLIQAEGLKAEANKTLIQGYTAEIQARMAQVEIFKAQVDGAKVLVQIEGEKISAAKESITAFVATVNAETAKVEAYKARVSAEATKVSVFDAQVRAYAAKAGAQAEKSRAYISRYSALAQAKSAEWSGYSARMQAEQARVQSITANNTTLIDAYRAATYQATANAELKTKVWETTMRQYEAGKQLALSAAKVNADQLLASKNLQADVAKTGAQVYAQLTSSAYSMIHASAGISSSGSSNMGTQVNYTYGGDVSSDVSPLTFVA